MNFAQVIHQRYTTKAYDSNRKIPQQTLDELLTLLRLSPSSVNSQPWHFLVFQSEEGKQKLATSLGDAYGANKAKVLNASCAIVFCARDQISDDYLDTLLEQEARDGRFTKSEMKDVTAQSRRFFVDLHRKQRNDAEHWMQKQVYLALGTALVSAGALGLDATPIEGFEETQVDQAFDLAGKGLKSQVIMALGYRSDSDFNAALPKSRLPEAAVITRL